MAEDRFKAIETTGQQRVAEMASANKKGSDICGDCVSWRKGFCSSLLRKKDRIQPACDRFGKLYARI